MTTHAGHNTNVGFTEKDVRNYITAKIQEVWRMVRLDVFQNYKCVFV